MKLDKAYPIAELVKLQLKPHCIKIEIAGSIRRGRPEVNDIEIVAIPKPYGVGLFESGIAGVVEQWERVRGYLPGKYTRRKLPQGIDLDLFFAREDNWGLILAIRTGSAEFGHHVLAAGWSARGYHSVCGMLCDPRGFLVPTPHERDVFEIAGVPWTEPGKRNM